MPARCDLNIYLMIYLCVDLVFERETRIIISGRQKQQRI
jgi:hypothetical protein